MVRLAPLARPVSHLVSELSPLFHGNHNQNAITRARLPRARA